MGLMDNVNDMKKKADSTDVDDKALAKLKEMRAKKNQDEATDQN
jgi:hypothetical protein